MSQFRVSQRATRIPALESLRSVLLLLGIVVHSAMILPEFYPKSSPFDTSAMRYIYSSIHVWRVPTYFIISGFLSAALFSRGSIWDFIRGRFKRVTSVLLAAQLFIIPFFILAGGRCDLCAPYGGTSWLQVGWLHLWFLYDLILITHLVVFVIWLKRKLPKNWQTAIASTLGKAKFGPVSTVSLALLSTAIPSTFEPDNLLRINFGVIPDLPLLAYHGLFFVVGWVIWRNKNLAELQASMWINIGFATTLALFVYGVGFPNILFANLTTWFAALGIIGLFLNYLNDPKPTWTFLNDAAYWVYLWHAIVILALCWIFNQLGLNIWVNLVASSAVTIAITLITYRWFVAPTLIGKYISGRRRYRTFVGN